MPLSIPILPERVAFFGLAPEEFDGLVARWGWPAYRAAQVRDWVYRKLVTDPAHMSNLSKLDRARLAENVSFDTATIATTQRSNDGTIKLLLTWPDGANAETVMIPDGDRRTACVSSQVGCPVGCKFCASGLNGVKGNLTAAQIVEQIVRLNQILSNDVLRAGDRAGSSRPDRDAVANPTPNLITNVVFMGMGEPMSNYANVMTA